MGSFLPSLPQKDKRLAGQLHKAAGTKPFTLALLNRGKKSKFKPGEELKMRVTLLDDSVFMKLADAFMNPQMELELQNARIIPTMINLSATDKGLWTGQQKWEEIYDSAGLENEIVLQFVTSTAFRQGGMDVPLPIPQLTFGSYLKKWKQFSPIPLHPDLQTVVEERIAVFEPSIKPAPFLPEKRGYLGLLVGVN
jgi:CRISPR-associated endoribonuclease Cas6